MWGAGERASPRGVFDQLYPIVGPWTEAALWHGLHSVEPPSAPLELELHHIVGQRLSPLLAQYLREVGPTVATEVRAAAELHAMAATAASAAVISASAPVLHALTEAGIPHAVVKGPAIAQHYAQWQHRPFSDLDIHVPRALFRSAIGLCGSMGLREDPSSRQPWGWFDRSCREAVNLKREDGASVDLHHHVPPWFWGSELGPESIIARAEQQPFLGQQLPLASPEDNLLVAALHVVSDKNLAGRTLLVWRDLAELARQVDVGILARRADETGLAPWVRAVLSQLPSFVRPVEIIDRLAMSPQQLRGTYRLRLLLDARTQASGVLLSQPLRLPIPHGMLYLAGMAFPSRPFLHVTLPGDPHPRRTWWRNRLLRAHDAKE